MAIMATSFPSFIGKGTLPAGEMSSSQIFTRIERDSNLFRGTCDRANQAFRLMGPDRVRRGMVAFEDYTPKAWGSCFVGTAFGVKRGAAPAEDQIQSRLPFVESIRCILELTGLYDNFPLALEHLAKLWLEKQDAIAAEAEAQAATAESIDRLIGETRHAQGSTVRVRRDLPAQGPQGCDGERDPGAGEAVDPRYACAVQGRQDGWDARGAGDP